MLVSLLALISAASAASVVAIPEDAAIGAQKRALASGDTVAASREIIVFGRAENLVGVAGAASEGHVGGADFQTRPLQRVGELLEVVPGMIVTQHSGSGKANQYFLRGFNLDHGTDFAAFLDGVPLNFRSHAHGQGYLDLNPIIPEGIESIDYRKGPYRAEMGDFASAGSGSFKTYDEFARPFVKIEGGAHQYLRGVAGGSLKLGGGTALALVEGHVDNTAYRLEQRLRSAKALLKWTGELGNGTLRATATGYHSQFRSTDQVPVRAIASGQIDRLGFIDPTDGGETTRLGATANWQQQGADPLHVLAYGYCYNFRLYSNFTYFLDDPVDGDQFKQLDRRIVTGGRIDKTLTFAPGGLPVELLAGLETRYDDIPRVELTRTRARRFIAPVRDDSIEELSVAAFAEATLRPTSKLRILLGARHDVYRFKTRADLAVNSGVRDASIFSPKVSVAWTPVEGAELYANFGRGFHSNDARGTVIRIDPLTGQPADPADPLVRSVGKEIGLRLRPVHGLSLTATAWRLNLASELLFSGDGGSTEPQGPSARRGVELAVFYDLNDWLAIDAEYTRSHGRFADLPRGEDRIPGAVETVLAGGVVVQHGRTTASLRARHFGSFALTEDNSRRSRPTTIVNGRLGYRLGRVQLAAEVFNLLGSRDNDITYFYTSRLPGEPAEGIDDFHVHPIEPRTVRVSTTFEL